MSTEIDSCEICRFWKKAGWTDRDGYSMGLCLRNAPIAIPVVMGQASTRTHWPDTQMHDWCGEFQRPVGPV